MKRLGRAGEGCHVISFEAVSWQNRAGDLLVDDISADIASEMTTVLLGTPRQTRQALLRLVLRLETPTTGVVKVAGVDLRRVDGLKFRRSLGWLSGPAQLFPHQSILEQVATTARLAGTLRRDADDVAQTMLDEVEVGNTERRPDELSSPERVRVGLARSFVHRPSLVVLDDPFAGVDSVERPLLRALLSRLRDDGPTTVLLATGDAEDALALGHRILLLLDGALVQSGSPTDILTRPTKGVESLLGAGLSLRGLAFVLVDDVPADIKAVVALGATAAEARRSAKRGPSSWVLVVDDDRRPVGWANTERLSADGPVTESPLVAVRGVVHASDTMQRALDYAVSSPSQMVPKVDDDGLVLGLFSQTTLSLHLARVKA